MTPISRHNGENGLKTTVAEKILLTVLCLLLSIPAEYVRGVVAPLPAARQTPQAPQDSTVYLDAKIVVPEPTAAGADASAADSTAANDSIPPTEVTADDYPYGLDGKIPFNPSPTRAVWLSALLPGLGQIYNRRYWKLPIVIGGFMGLGYAFQWNNNQYQDYLQGYRDLLDNDPDSKSYMDFFPPTVSESDLDRNWVTQTFKSRKDYYRRYRDLCVIGLVALYVLCMVDAYVDASMAHFDISPDLSLDWAPTMMRQPGGNGKPAFGLNWALTF